ncbi:hypothetical protein A9K65_008505 [Mesorhizobium sp. WSM1497]|nr:hypothetical protein A9K65_008505 [Mesorhizobium sp. WSM1497]
METGRTHQMRVHMAHIGHPVIGDGPPSTLGVSPDDAGEQSPLVTAAAYLSALCPVRGRELTVRSGVSPSDSCCSAFDPLLVNALMTPSDPKLTQLAKMGAAFSNQLLGC